MNTWQKESFQEVMEKKTREKKQVKELFVDSWEFDKMKKTLKKKMQHWIKPENLPF